MVRRTALHSKEPISQLLAGLRLGELPGLDPVPANFVAAAILACAPRMGPPQQVRFPSIHSPNNASQVSVCYSEAAAESPLHSHVKPDGSYP